ncbi:hypothetical protein [Aquamicrobium terrae]|uniref:Uncharacterized protein n=1 Tax=Aquamicrobium terrae TaxID=1324945 RepID=A0ABV2MW93_9HYPH
MCKASRRVAIAMSMAAALPLSIAAKAESVPETVDFAWSAQTAVIDFASPNGGRQFGEMVEAAHEKTILYLDWTMKGAAGSGLFDQVGEDGDDRPVADEAICGHVERGANRPAGFVVSGKPDPENNHLLFEMTLDVGRGAPFARARCEYADAGQALRVRGFFYVTNIGTATADRYEFHPISVPAHVVPERFLKNLR